MAPWGRPKPGASGLEWFPVRGRPAAERNGRQVVTEDSTAGHRGSGGGPRLHARDRPRTEPMTLEETPELREGGMQIGLPWKAGKGSHTGKKNETTDGPA